MDRPLTPIPSTEITESTNAEQLQSIMEDEETPQSAKSHHLFVSMYITLKGKIKEEDINIATIITILKTAMEMVELTDDLKGSEQKEFAVLLVKELINKSKMLSREQKRNCLMVIDLGILDNVVDFVVDATRGKLNINKKSIKKLFFCCNK